MGFLVALFFVVLQWSITALQLPSVSAHGCAPLTPPSVPGASAPAPATQGVVLLNEVLLSSQSPWNCLESGTSSSTQDFWVELYNPQNQPFNLYTAHATIDSGTNINAYYFPFGAAIAAHGFLVLFPHTSPSFFATETSTLRLLIADVVIDQVQVPQLAGDQSYARIPDGANTWQVTDTPTIDASNNPLQATPSPTSQATSSPTPHATPSPISSGHGGHGNSKVPPLVTGTQPAWGNLRLPARASTPTESLSSTTLPSSPQVTSDEMPLPRRVELTLLAAALALTLLWCWWLFKSEQLIDKMLSKKEGGNGS